MIETWFNARTIENYTIRTTSTNGSITLRYAKRLVPYLVLDEE